MTVNGVMAAGVAAAKTAVNDAKEAVQQAQKENIVIDFKSKAESLPPAAKGAIVGGAIGTLVFPGLGTAAGAAAGAATGKVAADKPEAGKVVGTAAAGAAIGTCICPGVGTAAGALIGGVVGWFL